MASTQRVSESCCSINSTFITVKHAKKHADSIKNFEECLRTDAFPFIALKMFYKAARVEYHPVGVVGAIVPWNYPFHNVFNPLTAALFAGNALVIKVCPCWCTEGSNTGMSGASFCLISLSVLRIASPWRCEVMQCTCWSITSGPWLIV